MPYLTLRYLRVPIVYGQCLCTYLSHVLFLHRYIVVFCNLNGAPRRQIDRDDGRRIHSRAEPS